MGDRDHVVGDRDRDVGGQGGSWWGRDRIRGDGALAGAAGAVRTATGAAGTSARAEEAADGWWGPRQGPR